MIYQNVADSPKLVINSDTFPSTWIDSDTAVARKAYIAMSLRASALAVVESIETMSKQGTL